MAAAARLDRRRVLVHVHMHGPGEPHLSILQDDRVLVLGDAIDRAIEGPVEDDAGRLAPHPGIVLGRKGPESCGRLFAELRQLRSAVTLWPAACGCQRTADS